MSEEMSFEVYETIGVGRGPVGLEPMFVMSLLGKDVRVEEYDLYWIFYAQEPVNKDSRKQLKEAGFKLLRHSRTNQEMWVYDKS